MLSDYDQGILKKLLYKYPEETKDFIKSLEKKNNQDLGWYVMQINTNPNSSSTYSLGINSYDTKEQLDKFYSNQQFVCIHHLALIDGKIVDVTEGENGK